MPDYIYTDGQGKELYRKVRTDTPQGKQIYTQPAGYQGRKVLYNLPAVIRAENVAIVEGEKCCQFGTELTGEWIFTTSGSANSWKPEFAEYLRGKRVVILPDNDEPGRSYSKAVASSLIGVADTVSICEIPGLPDKGDIADLSLDGGELESLIALYSEPYRAEANQASVASIFQRPSSITFSDEIDWIVENAIERGTNGLLYSEPKMAKSWIALDLALHVANGSFWFGRFVPKDCTVGVLSREDADSITVRRIKQLAKGNSLDEDKLLLAVRSRLYDASLDDPAWVESMTSHIRDSGVQFAVWDIFNRFHRAEENNNTEVRKVLDVLDNITVKTKCNHLLIHHTTKGSKSPRGASCIDGWAEFRMRVEWANKPAQKRGLIIDGKSNAENRPIVFSLQPRHGGIVLATDVAHLGNQEQEPY